MKFEFKRLVDPSEKVLNELSAQGFHFAGSGTAYEMHQCQRQPQLVVILQREVPDETEVPYSKELALREGIRDGIVTWLDGLSDASVRKIFSPQS